MLLIGALILFTGNLLCCSYIIRGNRSLHFSTCAALTILATVAERLNKIEIYALELGQSLVEPCCSDR